MIQYQPTAGVQEVWIARGQEGTLIQNGQTVGHVIGPTTTSVHAGQTLIVGLPGELGSYGLRCVGSPAGISARHLASVDDRCEPPRSARWPAIRRLHLARQPRCQWCGSTVDLEVHHIDPFHLDPADELNDGTDGTDGNLIMLCEKPGANCHLANGHLGDWHTFNPNIRAQCNARRERKLATATATAVLAVLALLAATGCVQPKAVEVQPQIAANVPVLSPQGNSVASPTIGSGNAATVPVSTVTSQPADQRATLTGGDADAGHDQANRTTNINVPVNVSGGGWVAAVFGLAAAAIILARIVIHVREQRLARRLGASVKPAPQSDSFVPPLVIVGYTVNSHYGPLDPFEITPPIGGSAVE